MVRPRLALLLILVLAAALRFRGLAWGLRHVPVDDERSFVENAAQMVAAGDLDHRFYEYPGLFFYLLYPVIAAVGPERASGPAGYLAARGLVAAFGVASVAAVYVLGSRIAGARAGLVAALLLAVSPLEVTTAHMVRPDVVLETFGLLALAAFLGVGERQRDDAVAGAALGAASAVKFTGALLAVSYLVSRLLAPGPRLRRVALAGLAAILVFLVFTPYAVIHSRDFLLGVKWQLGAHYGKGEQHTPFQISDAAVFYLGTVKDGLGAPATILLLGGILLSLRRWRTWAPLWALPAVTLAVWSTAGIKAPRFMVPVAGVLALMAALPIESLARSRPALAGLLTLAAAFFPLRSSVQWVDGVSRPSDRDKALDFVEAHLRSGSLVLDTRPDLGVGFDRRRLEVLATSYGPYRADMDPPPPPLARVLASHADLLLTGPGDSRRWGSELLTVFPEHPDGERFRLKVWPEGLRPRYQPVSLDRARLGSSQNAESLEALRDGQLGTAWETKGPQRRGDFVQVQLPEPVLLGRVELALGDRGERWAKGLLVFVTADGKDWRRVESVPGRPRVEQQAVRGPSQVLLLEPAEVRGIRIEQGGEAIRPWAIAELRLEARSR